MADIRNPEIVPEYLARGLAVDAVTWDRESTWDELSRRIGRAFPHPEYLLTLDEIANHGRKDNSVKLRFTLINRALFLLYLGREV